MRAFIAIELPESIRTRLGDLSSRLRRFRAKASWVQPDRMHMTLRFLGDITDEQAETLSSLIAQACSEAPVFTLTCGGLGAFPNLRRPNVVWAGIGPLEPDLLRVQSASESAARSCGLPAETKPFHPHVTLGRIKDPRNAAPLADAVRAASAFEAGAFEVSLVSLFSSELTPRGPIYTRIGEFPLHRDGS